MPAKGLPRLMTHNLNYTIAEVTNKFSVISLSVA
jgi:hypothetical protein